MSALKTIEEIKNFCKANSGNEQIWSGNKSTYQWKLGKTTAAGVVNGVVRKLAGTDVGGNQIWVVAGSMKVMNDGSIARFTGMSKEAQTKLVVADATVVATEEVPAHVTTGI